MTVVDLALATPLTSQFRATQLVAMLDDDERARADQFHQHDDRLLYITAHALNRLVLTRQRPSVDPSAWRFSVGAWGRPHPINPETGELRCNLSHTRGMTAVAVTEGTDVGVDVEWIRPDDWIFDTAPTVFSAAEVDSLGRLGNDERRDRFFLYWTLKESYIKARGMGVSLPLTLISFARTVGEQVTLDLDPSLGDDASSWAFATFRPSTDVRGAVAVRAPSIELELSWPDVA